MAAHGNVETSVGTMSKDTVVADSRFGVVSVADEISVVVDSRFEFFRSDRISISVDDKISIIADSRFEVEANEISVVDSTFGIVSVDDAIAKTVTVKQNEITRMMCRVCTPPIFECLCCLLSIVIDMDKCHVRS